MRDYECYKSIAKVKRERDVFNNYKDDYKVGDKVEAEHRNWTIWGINYDTKNLYHCINEYGFKGSFHAIDFN